MLRKLTRKEKKIQDGALLAGVLVFPSAPGRCFSIRSRCCPETLGTQDCRSGLGSGSTGLPIVPTTPQPPQKGQHAPVLHRDLLSCRHLPKVAAHQSSLTQRITPASTKQLPFSIASWITSPPKPPSSGCCRSSVGITCAAKSHLLFL